MIGVIYWSGTGNTEQMAQAVAGGIKAAGQEVEVKSVSEVSVDDAAAYEKLALGCADMGAEQLEEGEFEPFYTELEADGVAILGEPDDDGKAQCEELGKTLANA